MVELPAGQLGSHLVCRDDFFNLVQCYPVVAPVLIVIGCYMLPVVRKIDWEDFSESLPSFLTILVMQLAISITDGIAWGFFSYTLLKVCTGKARQVPAVVYVCSVLFVLYYAFARV
jgi:AGZA family xanthine/uracil permease-like MFS transporter